MSTWESLDARVILQASHDDAKATWPWVYKYPSPLVLKAVAKAVGGVGNLIDLLNDDPAYLLDCPAEKPSPHFPAEIKKWEIATSLRKHLEQLDKGSLSLLTEGINLRIEDELDPNKLSAGQVIEQVPTVFGRLEEYGDLLDKVPSKVRFAPLAYCALFHPDVLKSFTAPATRAGRMTVDVQFSAVVTDFEDDECGGGRAAQILALLDWLKSVWSAIDGHVEHDPLWNLVYHPSCQNLDKANTWFSGHWKTHGASKPNDSANLPRCPIGIDESVHEEFVKVARSFGNAWFVNSGFRRKLPATVANSERYVSAWCTAMFEVNFLLRRGNKPRFSYKLREIA
ncbi:MAG TPA: hypothetical protein VKX17_25710 [Planctomycetota bacterium]|nr:hypothetical protein [Planctomycetota bacterium]